MPAFSVGNVGQQININTVFAMKYMFGPHNNEYNRTWIRWRDYCSLVVFNFPIFMIRVYEWPEDSKKKSTLSLAFLGFTICFVERR